MKIPSTITPSKANIKGTLDELFPLPRTLVSEGYQKSLEILKARIRLSVTKFPSGSTAWDWKVPNEWNVRQAYIASADGSRKLVDYCDSNLRLSAYSQPFDGIVSREELIRHLSYSKLMPNAIPYNTLYYSRGWQFNVTEDEYLNGFLDGSYYVHIDVEEKPGNLQVAECFLPGETEEEIVISTYMCHPSMANDNLSGVVTAVELFRLLSQVPNRHYSYRLVILPETIGAICYLANRIDKKKIVGGYVVYICGDKGPLHYKRSYAETGVIDEAAVRALTQRGGNGKVRPFEPFGSDERQYNAPGVRLNFGAITRSPPSEFPEYHTSADNLEFVSLDSLVDTVSFLLETLNLLDINGIYLNLYKGEPFFSKHGIKYPTFHNTDNYLHTLLFKRIAYEIDGTKDIFTIADKLGVSVEEIVACVSQFEEKGLVQRKNMSPAHASVNSPSI